MKDKFAINIRIADDSIQLHINREDEQFYRDAGKYLKSKMTLYNDRFTKLQTEKLIQKVSNELANDINRNFSKTPSLTANTIRGHHPIDNSIAISIRQKNELMYRSAKIYLIDCRNYYKEKYPIQPAEMLSKIVLYHLAVEIEKIKCTCKYCGKRYGNTDYLKDNLCPSHPDGTLKGIHETAYKQE